MKDNFTSHRKMAACADNHFTIFGGLPADGLWTRQNLIRYKTTKYQEK
jgi:hypothetical protein